MEFPLLGLGHLEPQAPPAQALESAVAKYHSRIYCFKKDYKKVENGSAH